MSYDWALSVTSDVLKEKKWHAVEISDAIDALRSAWPQGLSQSEAVARFSAYGPNEIADVKKSSSWKLLLAQFRETLVLILIVAAIISAAVGEAIDAVVIIAIVCASAGLGFYQEHRAEESLAFLRKLSAPSATVIRDGQIKSVPAREVVPGDLVSLDTGDKVPADAKIFEAINLQINEAMLTGESTPVTKSTQNLPTPTPLNERSNIVYSGTIVTYGRGKALVVSIGMETEFGKIARLIETKDQEQTPLEKRMQALGNWMIKVLLVTVAAVSILGVIHGRAFLDMFLWGVSLAVAAVPEALPAVVTGALAVGVYRMARRNSIVRHLPATETLGSTTVICTDKTGTLTKGEMTVRNIHAEGKSFEVAGVGYDPQGDFKPNLSDANRDSVERICECGVLCNDANLTNQDGTWNVIGDPTEGALLVAAIKAGIDVEATQREMPRVAEIPFTSERKMMTTVHKTKQGNYLLASKGAPEIILEKCAIAGAQSSNIVLSEDSRREGLKINDEFAAHGFRILGFASKSIPFLPVEVGEAIEHDMTFLGLMAMVDPPRKEAGEAVELCEKAGIRVVMITGDHRLTANWVATELNILKEGGASLTGAELDKLSDDEFTAIVEKVNVYSRTSPEHKIRIVEALRQKGNVVAMTGDGINDAPALKRADIAIAMGITGTDVTKEASDMVLADDNFATIVAAVYEGRGIFENIKKYLTYLLSANIGEILIMAAAGLLALPLPLLAKHLLFVNLATDGLPALALGVDPPDQRIMEKPPRDSKEGIFANVHGWLAGIAILTLVTASVAFAYGLLSYGWGFNRPVELAELKARSMVFATIILFEIFFAFSCRSFDRTFISSRPLGNKPLLIVVLGQAIIMPFLFQVPLLANIFSVTALTSFEWLIVVVLGSLGFVASELSKLLRRSMK